MAIGSGAHQLIMPNQQAAAKYLPEWREWGLTQTPKLLRELTGGLNNSVFLIVSAQRRYVLKVFSRASVPACTLQKQAAEHGLAPTLVYSHPHGLYCVMDYVSAGSNNNTALMAPSLAKLHQLEFTAESEFDYNEVCSGYLALLENHYQARHLALQPALAAFATDASPRCLCHNDLVQENCLFVDGQMQFIDWEYAQPNNRWFDLASVVFYFSLSEAQTKAFLRDYCSQQNVIEQTNSRSLYAALCAVIWLDIIWHAERAIRLKLELDHTLQERKLVALNAAFKAFQNA